MPIIYGVNLLPASGEWVYDTIPHRSRQVTQTAPVLANLVAAPAGTRTDYSLSLDRLQALHPECTTVSLVVAWFGSSTDAAACRLYPSTIYPGGVSEALVNGAWVADPWRVSGLTQGSPGLIPISQTNGSFTYGGTPSDPSIVRCLRDLRARGFRTVFYPFILMDCAGFPWRGRIAPSCADISQGAADAVAAFLGPASPQQFTPDAANLTVNYAGSPTDYSFRRMILHYANLCALAGGVDLFLLGSELRGLEGARGPAWTPSGTLDAAGYVTWDYPLVAGLQRLAGDVRATFDAAGLTRSAKRNLIAYSADWSSWMGAAHTLAPGRSGVWPNLDALYASCDLVSFDNYLPLSDWARGDGGLDAATWTASGLPGLPSLHSLDYLKSNVEGGERFDWFYFDGTNDGRGPDPGGSALTVSLPQGDRLAQRRTPYQPGQELLAQKKLRWWWNSAHRAVYDIGDGQGEVPHGPATAWVPQSKSICFVEYGCPACDRGTNQPNVFFDPKSSESFTPWWSAWMPVEGGGYAPVRDDALQLLALQATAEYWFSDGNNAVSPAGVAMVEPLFTCAWNWDARPFPVFPQRRDIWGDTGNWPSGTWIDGKGAGTAAPPLAVPTAPPAPPLPMPPGLAWSARYRPLWPARTAAHVSGRETRAGCRASPRWRIEISFDLLRSTPAGGATSPEAGALLAAFVAARGQNGAVAVPLPAELGAGPAMPCRFADDGLDEEEFMDQLRRTGIVTLLGPAEAPLDVQP